MSKKKKKKKRVWILLPQMSNKEFEKLLKPLQVELVKMQEWVTTTAPRSAWSSKGAIRPGRAA